MAPRGTSSDYLLGILKRDHPAIFERVQAGEFPSVSAAAREAGIKAADLRRRMVLGENLHQVASTLKATYTQDQLQRLVEILDEEE